MIASTLLGATSEVWILRQARAITRFEPGFLCWKLLDDSLGNESIPVHVVRETCRMSFLRELLSKIRKVLTGNILGTKGPESREIRNLIESEKVEVILCQSGMTGLRMLPVAQSMGVPILVHFWGYDLSSYLNNKLYRWSLRCSINRFNAIVVVAEHQRDKLIALGADPNRITVIPYGAPLDRMKYKEIHMDKKKIKFISVSRLVPQKGVDYSLRAFKQVLDALPECEYHIISDGPEKKALISLRDELGLQDKVVFHGIVSFEDLRCLLYESDIFLQHSLQMRDGLNEGFGISITEAMASGLPVVVTNCGGIIDQVRNGENGFVTRQRSVDEFAASMLRLARDHHLRQKFGSEGRKTVETRFETKKQTEKLENLLLGIGKQCEGQQSGKIQLEG